MSNECQCPGIFFSLRNPRGGSPGGTAVGDRFGTLIIVDQKYMTPVVTAMPGPGMSVDTMCTAGADGNGSITFVPPIGSGAESVTVVVHPDSVIDIPAEFDDFPGTPTYEQYLIS